MGQGAVKSNGVGGSLPQHAPLAGAGEAPSRPAAGQGLSAQLDECRAYLDAMRNCADMLLASVSTIESVVLGPDHERVLDKIADAMERLADAALTIDQYLTGGLTPGTLPADDPRQRALLAGLLDVMNVMEQVYAKVAAYQRMLSDDGSGLPRA